MLNPQTLDKIRRLGGDALLLRTLDIFLRESPLQLDKARQGQATGDLDAVRKAAHRLIPSAGMLGAEELQQICQLVEQLAGEGLGDSMASLLVELEHEFRLAEQLVQVERQRIQSY